MTQIQKTILHEEITTLLETIREQFETLNSFEGKIPILEFEIIKDNIRKLYEKFYILQRMNDPFDAPKKEEQEIPMVQPVIPLKNAEPVEAESIPSYVPLAEFIEEVVEPSETEVESVEIDLPTSETPVEEPEEMDKSSDTLDETPKFDLFTSETTAFNDKLKEAREQSLGPRFKSPNSWDIKSFININEKFLFINELFDGDYKEYTHTIEIFNNFDDKGEAFEFLDSLLKNNLWNSTSPAFLKFKEIIEKRFG